jgi:hypothetical protein
VKGRARYPETAGAGHPEAVRPFPDAREASQRGVAVRRERLRDPAYRAAVGRRISEAKGGRVAVVCAVYGGAFRGPAAELGIETVLTPVRAPRANAVAERVIGTLRRECFDHVIPVDERHLRAIL